MKDFFYKLKYVQVKDILSIFYFLLALPLSYIVKLSEGKFWLVCEEKYEARDNGYWFFKYVRENQPEQKIIYAISDKSPDYWKVKRLGRVISYGTFKHWLYYLAAEVNISSQKGGKPNASVCYFLEVYGFLKNKRVFLQHGITKDDLPWLYYVNTRMELFICGAEPEYQFIKKNFGYPEHSLVYTGFSRFDNLFSTAGENNRILIMPSWRDWLSGQKIKNGKIDIKKTMYWQEWNSVLNSQKLKGIAEQYNLEIIFFPHRNMQQYLDSFSSCSERIKIADWKDWDIQNVLKSSNLMITDYSSVYFDFVYMKKPIIFYQFDEAEFREKQYKEGYFDYHNNPFGQSTNTQDELFIILEEIVKNKFSINEVFERGHKEFFPLCDRHNSKRIYDAIKKRFQER